MQVIEIDHGKLSYIGDHTRYEEESQFYKKFLGNLVRSCPKFIFDRNLEITTKVRFMYRTFVLFIYVFINVFILRQAVKEEEGDVLADIPTDIPTKGGLVRNAQEEY